MTGLTPEYLRTPIPSLHGHLFGYRITNVLENIVCNNDRYKNSFFPNSVSLWNELGPDFRGVESLSAFKRKLLKIFRPEKKSLYDIYDAIGIKWIFQLRVGLSPLKSHKKLHYFQDTPDDTCNCGLHSETTCHFLLHCPDFIVHRHELFEIVNPILYVHATGFVDDLKLVHLLLYGNVEFDLKENQSILKATIKYIKNSSRFSRL